MQAAKFDVRCPPWALPREEVPIQVQIEKTAADGLSEVVFDLPPCLRLVDTINVMAHEESGGRLVVKDIGKARRSEYDYFGVVVATREPFSDLKREVPVRASFVMKDGSVDAHIAPVRVFRPRLEFADVPDAVTLDDGGPDGRSIPIRLAFSGFGDITVRIICTIGGRIVSHGTSLLDMILDEFLRDQIEGSGGAPPDAPDVEVDPMAAALLADSFKRRMLSDESIKGMLNAGKIDGDTARELHRLADSDKERLLNHIHRTMPAIILSLLSDIRARALGENLQLESKTAIVAPVELPVNQLVVEFRYADALGNEYEPIRRTLKIDDRRRAKNGAGLAIPLSITADESGAYKNVGEMEIGSGG